MAGWWSGTLEAVGVGLWEATKMTQGFFFLDYESSRMVQR